VGTAISENVLYYKSSNGKAQAGRPQVFET